MNTLAPLWTPCFTDLDVLCIGKVVRDVSTDFDAYWQSDSAYPVKKGTRAHASKFN